MHNLLPSILLLLPIIPTTLSQPTILKRSSIPSETVPGKWIVQLAPQAVLDTTLLKKLNNLSGIKVDAKSSFDLDGLVKGFTVKANDSAIDALAGESALVAVRPATVLRAAVVVPVEGPRGYGGAKRNGNGNVKKKEKEIKKGSASIITQKDATWGLNRISTRGWTYSSRDFPQNLTEYRYDASAGQGATVYVVDTGVYTAHNDFSGRASNGANFVAGEGFEDLNGHGTNIASIISGTTHGVAKLSHLISVKALGASGSTDTSIILQALQWIHSDATTHKRRKTSVVNLSFDGPYDQILNDAVDALAKAGLFIVTAAGNYAADARGYSPAAAEGACAVGSMSWVDSVNTFSNFGPKVALHAPGLRILAAANTGPDSVAEMTGTSQAAPHVAGLGAYLLRLDSKKYVGKTLCRQMQAMASKGQLKSDDGSPIVEGTPNLVAFNGVGKGR